MKTKFALHNFAGKPTAFYLVEAEDVGAKAPTAVKTPSHHIAILDVSGSMYCDLDAVKSTVEKVFTAQEFKDPTQRVSLVTYSSNGDCRVHFRRVTVEEVMAPNSPHLQEIRGLRVRGMTGISQSLVEAEKLIDDSEITCISLHSDGYANDPSPYTEAQALMAAAKNIAKHPNVFCNTVAYRSYCDFALLAAIANQLSGTCLQAQSARQVYDALYGAQSLLAGQVSPVIEAGIGNFDFVTFVSTKAKKVLGGTAALAIRGLKGDDDKMVYRYRKVSEADYGAASVPEDNPGAVLAFCRANIALGNLNTAKYAMVTTRYGNLIQPHAKAMVASEIAAWAGAVEQFLFEPTTVTQQGTYGLGTTGPSVLTVLKTFNQFRSSLRVHLPSLLQGYKRRGLKRVAGVRNPDGSLTKPDYDTKPKTAEEWLAVSGIDINRDTATANIRLVQDVNIVEAATGNVVSEVAGIKLDIKDFKNYTLVGDGQVNVGSLTIRTSDKRCFAALQGLGLVTGDFDPNARLDIRLDNLPLVDYDQSFGSLPSDTADKLAKLTVLQKLLSGLTKEVSEALTPEQIAELKKYLLTPALYFSPPTTNAYTDLAVALSQGQVDTRLSYKIKLGTTAITNLGKLASGNAYLQRRFTLTNAKGDAVEKPTLPMWWEDGGTWGIKQLSARTVLDAVDALTYPIYEDFLGLGKNGALTQVLGYLGYDAGDIHEFETALTGGATRDEATEAFARTLRHVEETIDAVYDETISPLAFYVGATGLVPDALDAPALTADQLTAKHPAVKLSKDEKEGTFYELPGGLLLTVFISAEHFTTELGAKAAEAA